MRNIIICTAAVLGMVFVGSTQVDAGHGHNNHHGHSNHGHNSHRGHSNHNNHSNHGNYNRSGFSYNSRNFSIQYNSGNRYRGYGVQINTAPAWHDTSHYDYHGPSLQRHGNHYDYVPGHYDLHRTGHYDY